MASFTTDAFVIKAGLAKMLKGGVIMDVVNVEQAKVCPMLTDNVQCSLCEMNLIYCTSICIKMLFGTCCN